MPSKDDNSILFISLESLLGLPYLKQYERCFEGTYDLVYWNKDGITDPYPRANLIAFNHPNNSKIDKMIGYIRFARFTRGVLRTKHYRKVVVLHTQAAILLEGVLTKQYQKGYICDIRDYTFENSLVYRQIEKRVLERSALNVVSSRGYLDFLPKGLNYYLLHNSHASFPKKRKTNREGNSITIGNIGGIRFHKQCRLFIDRFGRDSRYNLIFCGTGAEELRCSCSGFDLSRTTFIDKLVPSETESYLNKCDLLFNLYGNHTPLLDYALSNRLYYCAEYGIPILTCPDTYMHQVENQYNLGFCVNLNDSNPNEKLFQEYNSFDYSSFDCGRAQFLNEVRKDNESTLKEITSYFDK